MLRLAQSGPHTVPQFARARLVSRQSIQKSVNELEAESYVEFVENDAHKRSPLVQLTPKGKEALHTMLQREMQIVASMEIDISEELLRTTTTGLQRVRQWLEREHRRLLKTQEITHTLDERENTDE